MTTNEESKTENKPTPQGGNAPTPQGGNRPPQGADRGKRPKRKSRYGEQLEEKQNLKDIYKLRERQLKKYFVEAQKSKDETGPHMMELLERRLDSAIYRAGFAATRAQARQMASHRLFAVNGRPTDVPSCRLKNGDNVAVRESKRGQAHFSNFEKRMQNVRAPEWMQLKVDGYGFEVISAPLAEDASVGIDLQAIVELLGR
jgi:small subunit ribosomal protein S4